MSKTPRKNDLRVWWIPQVGQNPTFYHPVENIHEAKLLLDALAEYDLFQLKHNIKPDFSNAGGLQVFEDGEWLDWEDPETGEGIDDVEDPGV